MKVTGTAARALGIVALAGVCLGAQAVSDPGRPVQVPRELPVRLGHPTIPLVYKYYGSRSPSINPAWIHALEMSANTNAGLHIVAEPSAAQNGNHTA